MRKWRAPPFFKEVDYLAFMLQIGYFAPMTQEFHEYSFETTFIVNLCGRYVL